MSVSRLGPRHAAEYRTLMLEAYEFHPEAFRSTVAERGALPLGWWQRRLAPEAEASEVVFGAFSGDQIVGVAGVSFETRPKTDHKAVLYGLYVRSGYRNRGLGRLLVNAVVDHARARPRTAILQLGVIEGNAAARRLYESCGFESFGVEPMAVRMGTRFVAMVHMWRDLRDRRDR